MNNRHLIEIILLYLRPEPGMLCVHRIGRWWWRSNVKEREGKQSRQSNRD